jgi:hypothetical protein
VLVSRVVETRGFLSQESVHIDEERRVDPEGSAAKRQC